MLDWSLLPIVYQIIHLNSTQPCFLNYTAGANMWQQCGFSKDYLQASLAPWEWVTGGWFSMILVSVLIGMTYLKYQKAAYPLIIGTIFLPISFTLFPQTFLVWAIVMTGMFIGIISWYAYISQANEM
jgi:hypothetical protein